MSEEPLKKTQATAGLFHLSVAQFLIALILLLVSSPFVTDLEHGVLIEDVIMMIILILAVLAAGGHHWLLTILLAIPALAGPWLHRLQPELVPFWLISCAHM